jgi:hypothetical protein
MSVVASKFRRQGERGQTIALVAISMVSLLAMAALAIDLTTLYVARGEVQRAADTVALAGAKAFVDSGVTTNAATPAVQALAQRLANAYATAAVGQNNVAGAPAQMVGAPAIDFSLSGNPRITVSLRKTNLPVFFARIWGNSSAAVAATATAEAYNPAYSQTNVGSFVPAAPKCVKPFLVPNEDQQQGFPQFVDPATGMVNTSAPIPFLGEQITLTAACIPGQGQTGCTVPGGPKQTKPPLPGNYLPMLTTGAHTYCPNASSLGCAGNGGSNFERSTQCCDGTPFDFQQCGASANLVSWDNSNDPGGPGGATQEGLQCLIHTTSTGSPLGVAEQDSLDPTNFAAGTGPAQISPGSFSQSRYNIPGNSLIATSDSIITVPIFAVPLSMPSNHQLTVVGFLQIFVDYVGTGRNDINGHILNVVGCGSTTASGAAVSGGGVSPIPVRLIHN